MPNRFWVVRGGIEFGLWCKTGFGGIRVRARVRVRVQNRFDWHLRLHPWQ